MICDVAGRRAVVTGAAAGIGLATARILSTNGARVVLADRDEERALAAARTLDDASVVRYEAADESSVIDMVEEAGCRLGGIDILVNNAAMTADAYGRDGPIGSIDTRFWETMFAVNLRATMVASRSVIARAAGGSCSIVNLSSLAAQVGSAAFSAYSASKAAIESLTRSIAVQYGKCGIRCNAVAPGIILTAQVEENLAAFLPLILRRLPAPAFGSAEDVAAVIVFLASDASRFINGQIIAVDGGQSSGSVEAS